MLAALTALAVLTQNPVPRPDTIALEFGWRPGMRATVTSRRYRERRNGSVYDTSLTEFSYQVEVRDHPQGLLVRVANPRVTSEAGPPSQVKAINSVMASLVPSYVVSRNGELLALADAAGLRAYLDSIVRSMQPMLDTLPPEVSQTMRALMSEETLLSVLGQEWNAMVGFWIQAKLELGSAYQLEGEEPVPALGASLPFRYEFGIADRVQCDSARGGQDCVSLRLESAPKPSAVTAALEAFVRRLVPGASDLRLTRFSITNEIEVITRPGSLLPVRLQIMKEVEAEAEAAGERSQLRQVDYTRTSWRIEP